MKKIATASLITYLTAIIMFIFDQWSKFYIVENLALRESWEIFSWLNFTYVQNIGAAFSILEGKVFFLLLIVGIETLAILIYERISYKTRSKILSFSIGFILAGALGNFVDRFRLSYVVDFLSLLNPSNGKPAFAIFNVADISVNIGMALLIIYFIFQEKIDGPDKSQLKSN